MNGAMLGEIRTSKDLQLNFSDKRGRYLISKKSFQPGDEVLSEAAFAVILPDFTTSSHNSNICHYCFKSTTGSAVKCFGCSTALYCKEACKRSAWKSNHWMECVMGNMLVGMETEVRMSLRVLLNAASQLHNKKEEDSLYKIAKSLVSSAHTMDGCAVNDSTKGKLYRGCYWSVFCLQTHNKEPKVLQDGNKMMKDINVLVSVLCSCFLWLDKFKENKNEMGPNKGLPNTPDSYKNMRLLLESVFKNLCFLSYCDTQDFDIRTWRSVMQAFCSSANKNLIEVSQSAEEILSTVPKTTEHCLARLLLHHALQLRTNGQAIYKLFEIEDHCGTKSAEEIEQRRIGIAYFPVMSLMNHSCSPNTTVYFDGRTIKVVAIKKIKKGEEVLHCYGPECKRYSLEERRKILSEQYFFCCECEMCIAEDQDEELKSCRLQFVGLKCKYCNDPLKEDIKLLSGICINTECQKEQGLIEPFAIRQRANEMYIEGMNLLAEDKVGNALKMFLRSLDQMKTVLYHNALDIAKVNDAIGRCYVTQKKYSQALSHLCQSAKIIGMLHGADSIEMGHELMKLASVYFNLGDHRNAAKKARQVLAIFRKFYPNPKNYPPGTSAMENIVKIASEN